ncbi:endonuclease/exonuclease/phosphatase family protein [Nesterenkonia sphaerica]|uniref:Endonuclease/exonuclease/phosphatase family protein n=1 Tax=Nesterenkonia sphaerica TaxID=1804988 RepID=A0A5R9A6J3_9MICC|nr:endonuclease/exonuclease/phosphatase family protein [Nesterenkonia sphaerica]TLP74339.1 endonuclease/exonuclease/phosphatase family protein [Nesterenkonia sphaerica]
MPTGSYPPALRMKQRNIAKTGAALAVSANLVFTAVPAAQSSTAPTAHSAVVGVADDATPDALFPAPGQPNALSSDDDKTATTVHKDEEDLRVATLHADITADPSADEPVAELIASLSTGNHTQARAVAQTVQMNDPDVLVLTGVTYDDEHHIAELLREYFAAGQHSESGLDYPYFFTAETNSGRESGVDLDGDGIIGGAGDAVGYGEYPGQYGMIVFSKYPVVDEEVRTFQDFLWRDLPESAMVQGQHFSLKSSVLRLNETSMWDVPVEVDGETIHLISSALAAPAEHADTERGDDMRQVLADYVEGRAWYLYDDEGETGHPAPGTRFVVAGAPSASADEPENLEVLLDSPMLRDTQPEAVTEVPEDQHPAAAWATDLVDTRHVADNEGQRASFVLPSRSLQISNSGVFWPAEGEFGYEVVDPDSSYSLQDRLVWVDLTISD